MSREYAMNEGDLYIQVRITDATARRCTLAELREKATYEFKATLEDALRQLERPGLLDKDAE
jgi:hypothetical protein